MEKVEEMSVAQLLFAEGFTFFTEEMPLRPVGPAVSTTVLTGLLPHGRHKS